MPFGAGLRQSLQVRDCEAVTEFMRGDSLEDVLDRHLLAVEEAAESELLTSVLLVSRDGKRLSHGAAPNLAQSYREAIDGCEIGPSAGSCGTAAYLGRPIYVSDIANDALWNDYRHLALPLGLLSCWSTPIRSPDGSLIGTFAIYHRTIGDPSRDELEAIEMITGSVAQAIMSARDGEIFNAPVAGYAGTPPRLRLVADNPAMDRQTPHAFDRLLAKVAKLEEIVGALEDKAQDSGSAKYRARIDDVARTGRSLAKLVRTHLKRIRKPD